MRSYIGFWKISIGLSVLALVSAFCIYAGMALSALAADPSPLPSVVATGVAPAVVIGGWAQLVQGFTNGALALGIGAVLEVVLRIIPTQKPLSIGYAIADGCHAVGVLFDSLGAAADKILPNRLHVK
jgi:hypothetical protein